MKKAIIGLAALLVGIASAEAQVSSVDVNFSAEIGVATAEITFAKKPRRVRTGSVCSLQLDSTLGYQGSTTASSSKRSTVRYKATSKRKKTISCTIQNVFGVGVGTGDALPIVSVFVTASNKCFAGVSAESSSGGAAFATCTTSTVQQSNDVFLNRIAAGIKKCVKEAATS